MAKYFKLMKSKEVSAEVDLELLQKAVREADNGMSIKEAAETNGQTFNQVLKRADRKNRPKALSVAKNPWRGSSTPAFTEAEEAELAVWFEEGEPKLKKDVSGFFCLMSN